MNVNISLDAALKKLERNPTSALLLSELWKDIQNFDFSKNRVLEVPMLYHDVWCGNGYKVLPYSHSAIRKALTPLGLEPVGLHANKQTIKIKQKKNFRKKVSQK